MQYQKFTVGKTFIEFHNNWLGEETVVVNGQTVSRKSSVWGTNHKFTLLERPLEGFECLRLAVEKGLKNTEAILNHDMLAFLRMNEGFEGFLGSRFREYDREVVRGEGNGTNASSLD